MVDYIPIPTPCDLMKNDDKYKTKRMHLSIILISHYFTLTIR